MSAPEPSLPSKEELGLSAWLPPASEGQYFGFDRTAPPLVGRRVYTRSRWLRAREWFARVVLRVAVE